MDNSFNSEGSMDSPNTADWKRYRHCTGVYTEHERDFLIRNGFMRQDEDGEYHEKSTIIDSDTAEVTDEEDEVENMREYQGIEKGDDKRLTNDLEVEEIDELISLSDKSDRLPPLEHPEVEEIKSADVSEMTNENIEQISNISRVSMKEDLEDALDIKNEQSMMDVPTVDLPDDPAGIASQLQPAVVILTDDKSIGEEFILHSVPDVPGIDDMSPANVMDEDSSSHNNTTDSLADISLDAISDASFNLDLSDDMDGKPAAFDESFKTCDSAASTASFRSCKDKREGARSSPEDLDDTITLMERLLEMADEQEANEAKEEAEHNNVQMIEDETGEAFRTMFQTPMKSPQFSSTQVSYDPTLDLPSTPSIFATPKLPAPVRRSKRISLSNVGSPIPTSPQKTKGKNMTVSPTVGNVAFGLSSPSPTKEKSPLGRPNFAPPRPPVDNNRIGKYSPKPAVQGNRLVSILDSPATRTNRNLNPPPTKMITPSSRGQRTPEKKLSANGHPITSPVANYIYSLPPPPQIKRIAPPNFGFAQDGHKSSPKSKSEGNEELQKITRIPQPKSSLPLRHLGTLTESGDNVRKGRETLDNLFAGSKQKEFTPTHYIGSDSLRPISMPNTVGDPTQPHRYPQGAQGITPVSSRHLGKRDSKNASMVAEANVQRKFCPESSPQRPADMM